MQERKLYPLTPAQQLMFYAWRFTIYKQLMNIPTTCLTIEPLDLNVLKKAASLAIQRNDVFGLRLTREDKKSFQYFTDRAVLALEIIDFSDKSMAEMDRYLYKIGATSARVYEQPLASVYIIKTPDGKSGIFSCINHLIMDSWAITMFYKDIWEIYYALQNNEPLPKPLPDYEPELKKELAYQTSERHARDLAFWNNEIDGPPPLGTHVNGAIVLEKWRKHKRDPQYRFYRSVHFQTTARHVIHMVGSDDVAQMAAFCQANRLPTTQVLFTLGVRLYLAKVNNRADDVSIHTIAARRGTIHEKSCSGTRVHPLLLRTIMTEDLTFQDALLMIQEKQHTLYRHVDFSPLEMFNLMRKHFDYSPLEGFVALHLTFQPVPLTDRKGLPVTTHWYCNGAAASALGLSIMDGDGSGALRCYYEYQDKQVKPATVIKFHRYMIDVIRAGIANPAITLKELLDLPI